MIIPKEIQQKYNQDIGIIIAVEERVKSTLLEFCSSGGYVFDGRRKDVDSLSEKIETGRFRSWQELDDLYACTVAVPLPSDEETVLTFLREAFDQIAVRKKLSAPKAPDVFRFDSTRFYGRLRVPDGVDKSQSIYNVRFEVQIKSLFEFAWSRTTHALAYKTPTTDWRAQRLAAALKASVEQIDLLLSRFSESLEGIEEPKWKESLLKKEFEHIFVASRFSLPTEVWPKDMSRFVSNCYELIEAFQEQERINQRNATLSIHKNARHLVERYISSTPSNNFPRSISLFQVVFGILSSTYELPPTRNSFFPVTSDMETLFPHVGTVRHRFAFD